MTGAATVYIADDDSTLLKSLRYLLESVGLKAVTFESAGEFIERFDATQHGCLLLDVRMPAMSGLELQRVLKSRSIAIPIIVFTGHGDVGMAVQCMKEGAFDFIEKPYNEQKLLDRIQDAIEHDKVVREELARRTEAAERIKQLTPRELQVMHLVVEGLANKQVAARLGISEKTVEAHRSHIMKKVRADGLAQLVKIAMSARKN